MTTATFTQAANESITVYQDPNCGCCSGWVEHMRASGFMVKAIKTDDMTSIKTKLGVPVSLGSCHTGVVDASGQVIEGHVPASVRSEEHTSELQSLMRISYAVFCLKKKNK